MSAEEELCKSSSGSNALYGGARRTRGACQFSQEGRVPRVRKAEESGSGSAGELPLWWIVEASCWIKPVLYGIYDEQLKSLLHSVYNE